MKTSSLSSLTHYE